MSVQELEKAVAQLSSPELAQFTVWFKEFQAAFSSNLNQVMPSAVQGKTAHLGRTRLAQECAKLDLVEEQAWAELA